MIYIEKDLCGCRPHLDPVLSMNDDSNSRVVIFQQNKKTFN